MSAVLNISITSIPSSPHPNAAINNLRPYPEKRRSHFSTTQGGADLRVAPSGAPPLRVTFCIIRQELKASDTRASLDTLQRRLGRIINDLTAQDMNLTATRSQIADAGFAGGLTEFTRSQLQDHADAAIRSQANLNPMDVFRLLS